MICERILELICLTNFLSRKNRKNELESELLEPYVINNAEKSE